MTQVASTQLGESLGTERAEIPWQLVRRLPDLSRAITGIGASHKHFSAHWKETGS